LSQTIWCSFSQFNVVGSDSYRIKWNGAKVQGHSRSPRLVPIKSPYETTHVIVDHANPRRISHCLRYRGVVVKSLPSIEGASL